MQLTPIICPLNQTTWESLLYGNYFSLTEVCHKEFGLPFPSLWFVWSLVYPVFDSLETLYNLVFGLILDNKLCHNTKTNICLHSQKEKKYFVVL